MFVTSVMGRSVTKSALGAVVVVVVSAPLEGAGFDALGAFDFAVVLDDIA